MLVIRKGLHPPPPSCTLTDKCQITMAPLLLEKTTTTTTMAAEVVDLNQAPQYQPQGATATFHS